MTYNIEQRTGKIVNMEHTTVNGEPVTLYMIDTKAPVAKINRALVTSNRSLDDYVYAVQLGGHYNRFSRGERVTVFLDTDNSFEMDNHSYLEVVSGKYDGEETICLGAPSKR